MARNPKPLELVKGHLTKAEKAKRAKGESELLTGAPLKEVPEVRKNPIAHKEFARIRKLLKSINKDDDLYGNQINTHCLLHAECKQLEELKVNLTNDMQKLDKSPEEEPIPITDLVKLKAIIQKQILNTDKALMAKRKMMLDIAKENIMTVQSALRSVPKKEEKQQKSKMSSFLQQRGIGVSNERG